MQRMVTVLGWVGLVVLALAVNIARYPQVTQPLAQTFTAGEAAVAPGGSSQTASIPAPPASINPTSGVPAVAASRLDPHSDSLIVDPAAGRTPNQAVAHGAPPAGMICDGNSCHFVGAEKADEGTGLRIEQGRARHLPPVQRTEPAPPNLEALSRAGVLPIYPWTSP